MMYVIVNKEAYEKGEIKCFHPGGHYGFSTTRPQLYKTESAAKSVVSRFHNNVTSKYVIKGIKSEDLLSILRDM